MLFNWCRSFTSVSSFVAYKKYYNKAIFFFSDMKGMDGWFLNWISSIFLMAFTVFIITKIIRDYFSLAQVYFGKNLKKLHAEISIQVQLMESWQIFNWADFKMNVFEIYNALNLKKLGDNCLKYFFIWILNT